MKKSEIEITEPEVKILPELAKVNEIKHKIDSLATDKAALETQITKLQEQRANDLLEGTSSKAGPQLAVMRGEIEDYDLAIQKAQKLLEEAEEAVVRVRLMAAHDELNRLRPLLYQADAVVKMFMAKAKEAGDEEAKIHGLIGQQQLIIKQLTPRYVPPESSGPTFTDWNGVPATMDRDY
jgi:chromosome segregation ATPase